MKTLLLCTLLLAASCSFKKSRSDNETQNGHEELYSEPEAPKLRELGENEKRVVIAATNDMQGNYTPDIVSFKDNENDKKQQIAIGGKNIIQAYLSILKDTYKNIVLVDSGNIFSSASRVNKVKDFYSSLGYDAVTLGLRDFNIKVPGKYKSNADLFQNFAKKSDVPVLLSNLYELKTARVVEWKGTKPYTLKEIDGVKVGIIGLIPDDIAEKTPVNNRVGLFVENMLQSTLRHARLLKSLGADIIVVLTHQGIDCSGKLAEQSKLPPSKVNFDPKRENICDLKNSLGEYLERLPPNLVDVVVGGRTDQKTANFINGTLVLSSFPGGKGFSYAEFIVDTKTDKVKEVEVHQPVLFCHEFFKETKDCYTEDPSVDHKKRIPATFLGIPVKAEKEAQTVQAKAESFNSNDIPKKLVKFEADLSFISETSGETQLVVLTMNGRELLKVLEEDFNRGRKNSWIPSPFLAGKNSDVTVSIGGEELELNKNYRILSDLESIQQHYLLVKRVSNAETKSFHNHSWNMSLEDEISTALAGQAK